MIDNLVLLSDIPYDFGVCKIYKPTLRQISENQDMYKKYLSMLVFDKSDISKENFKNIRDEDYEKIKTFDIILVTCESIDSYKDDIVNAIEYFTKEKVHVVCDNYRGFFYFGEISDNRILSRENFDDFKMALREICCVKNSDDDIVSDLNIEDKAELERIKKIRERLKKAKMNDIENNSDGEKLELADLISAFCSISNNLNILDVWDMTIYQFYNQFERTRLIDEYRTQIQSIFAGADIKDVKHWLSKI